MRKKGVERKLTLIFISFPKLFSHRIQIQAILHKTRRETNSTLIPRRASLSFLSEGRKTLNYVQWPRKTGASGDITIVG